ncbi:hypothetical protein EW146_g7719 [Bondarzewia mesenterica]|uniref:Uncharacterized protein n=1 Tax=Bondarzewia mesenterica TaxID=1095465 RepID=A0A4S4LLW1_9AGAM|nr:hypothetical protein EW146_g7719 [Bondarzewia mesenterica]
MRIATLDRVSPYVYPIGTSLSQRSNSQHRVHNRTGPAAMVRIRPSMAVRDKRRLEARIHRPDSYVCVSAFEFTQSLRDPLVTESDETNLHALALLALSILAAPSISNEIYLIVAVPQVNNWVLTCPRLDNDTSPS